MKGSWVHGFNQTVLDVNTNYEFKLVKAFIRHHGRPWSDVRPPNALPDAKTEGSAQPALGENFLIKNGPDSASAENKKKSSNHIDRWMADQTRRIPRYSYDAPGAAAEPNGFETRLTNERRNVPYLPPNERFEAMMERNAT
ncbi:MAG: hypothetical protein Q9226_005039 [Calogaya cf. arnoldii]